MSDTGLLDDQGTQPPQGEQPPPDTKPQGEQSWLDSLPDDLKGSPSLARYKESGPEGVARAYLNAEKLIGSDKVPIPKDPGDTEGWERYYKAGGRPDEPTQYEFKRPEKLPEGVNYDENMELWWRQAAHEAGLNQRQFNNIVDKYRDRFTYQYDLSTKAASQEAQQGKLVLQRDWGNQYQARYDLANAAFAEIPDDVRNRMIAAGVHRMPSFVKYLYDNKARTTGEMDPSGGHGGSESPDAIQQKIASFRTDHANALMNRDHPDHDMRSSQLKEMYERMFPNAQ